VKVASAALEPGADRREEHPPRPASMKSPSPQRKHSEKRGCLSCRKALNCVSLCLSAGGNPKNFIKTKVFLRNRATGQYYTGSTGWSGNSSAAHDFDAVESATRFAKTERLSGMEVLVRDNFGCDLILPLSGES
jgi:hypothetical protein